MQQLKSFLVILFVFCTGILFAQVEEKDPSGEFVYKGNQFRPDRPYIVVSIGRGYVPDTNRWEGMVGIDYHYPITPLFLLNAGFLTSRQSFFSKDILTNKWHRTPHYANDYSHNNLHLTFGMRQELLKHNFAAYLGPSYCYGYNYAGMNAKGETFHQAYRRAGITFLAQYAWKYYYDLGVGAGITYSYCTDYQLLALQLQFYFGSAFKNKVYGAY